MDFSRTKLAASKQWLNQGGNPEVQRLAQLQSAALIPKECAVPLRQNGGETKETSFQIWKGHRYEVVPTSGWWTWLGPAGQQKPDMPKAEGNKRHNIYLDLDHDEIPRRNKLKTEPTRKSLFCVLLTGLLTFPPKLLLLGSWKLTLRLGLNLLVTWLKFGSPKLWTIYCVFGMRSGARDHWLFGGL